MLGETQTFPATSGTAIGWLGMIAIAALLVTLVLTDRSLQGLRWAAGLTVAGLLVYGFLIRPKIAVRERTLVLINPFEDIEIPLGLVDEFRVRSATFVHVGRKRYVGVAIGRKVRAMVRPQSEGLPSGSMMASRIRTAAPEAIPGRGTIDLFEDRVAISRQDAKRLGETDGAVRRTPVWWLLGSITAMAVALVLLLVL